MIKNKFLLKQLIWLIKEEKNFYDNYDNYDNYNNCLIINYINYIEILYSIIKLLD